MNICPSCGAQVNEQQNYCVICGWNLRGDAPTAEPTAAAYQSSYYGSAPIVGIHTEVLTKGEFLKLPENNGIRRWLNVISVIIGIIAALRVTLALFIFLGLLLDLVDEEETRVLLSFVLYILADAAVITAIGVGIRKYCSMTGGILFLIHSGITGLGFFNAMILYLLGINWIAALLSALSGNSILVDSLEKMMAYIVVAIVVFAVYLLLKIIAAIYTIVCLNRFNNRWDDYKRAYALVI